MVGENIVFLTRFFLEIDRFTWRNPIVHHFSVFTLGSLFFIASFGLLKGPVIHAKSLMKKEKLPFTGAYIGSLFLTLYTACVLQSQFLTIFSSGIQLAALVYFFMSYIPGGVTGVTFMCKTMANMCIRLFPA